MCRLLPVAILCLTIVVTVALAAGCGGAPGPVFISSRDNAQRKTCQANMKTVQTQSNVYAASNEGSYPGSLDDFAGYLDNPNVTCPSGGTITWNFSGGQGGRPPSPSCSEHGTPSR